MPLARRSCRAPARKLTSARPQRGSGIRVLASRGPGLRRDRDKRGRGGARADDEGGSPVAEAGR